MSQEDLVYEVLKECFDPEIPLNVVDLGLIYEVKAGTEAVDVKMSVTSPACPSGATIAEDIRTKLCNAGFPNQAGPQPAWVLVVVRLCADSTFRGASLKKVL
jgi:metal-sulfur cluster biosynthetic enzyme